MKITVNKKDVELNFGVKMVRELDKVAGMEANGANFGFGLTKSLPQLDVYDPAALSDVLYSATAYIKMNRPSRDDVDDFVDNCEDLEKVFDEAKQEMNKANAIKVALKNMEA